MAAGGRWRGMAQHAASRQQNIAKIERWRHEISLRHGVENVARIKGNSIAACKSAATAAVSRVASLRGTRHALGIMAALARNRLHISWRHARHQRYRPFAPA